MSAELRLILKPDATYAALAARPMSIGAIRALRRPVLVAVVLGTSMALSSTRHATPALVLSTTLLWSAVVVAQVVIALAVIGTTQLEAVGRPRALDLFFASHAPWSLWLLAAAAWAPSALGRPGMPVWITAVAAIALTPRMIAAFFRQVLKMDRHRAAMRTLVHQTLTWGLFVAFYGAAVALWPRILHLLS
ncbi:MAG TPA: hypothetical protein VFZ98_03460 [Vicinamibacterales bacterium]